MLPKALRDCTRPQTIPLPSSACGFAMMPENCARIRKERGLTQEQLSELCGLSLQYLSDLERGKRNPTIVTLYEIAQALEVSHVDLVTPG